MQYRKGQHVRHPKKHDWGIGEVLEDCQDDKIRIYFSEVGEKKLSLQNISLELVEDGTMVIPTRGRLALLPRINMDKVERLCEEFKAEMQGLRKGYNDAGVAEIILMELKQNGRLSFATVKRLSAWCHTNGPVYQSGVPIAQNISVALFGHIIKVE